MALATYPRLSVKTRLGLKNLLDSNDVFAELSDDAKNSCINIACQDISTFRNGLDKEDYWFSSDNAAAVFGAVVGGDSINNFDLSEKAWIIMASPNVEWNGANINIPRVTVYQSGYAGFSTAVIADATAPAGYVIRLTSSAAFSKGVLPLNSQPYVTSVTYVSSSLIEVRPKLDWGILSLVLKEVA